MYIFLIVLIIIASILLVLAVLAQNPKGGMAANFGASNQVMGVRQTADFLERSTWALAIAMSSHRRNTLGAGDKVLEQITTEREIALPNTVAPVAPATELPAAESAPAAEGTAATEAAE